ncbi:MAG: LAGLIDADG family homing endonuclease [Candidatus Micrarchaeia archaeon]
MEINGYVYGILAMKGVKSGRRIWVEISDEELKKIAKEKLRSLIKKIYTRKRCGKKHYESLLIILEIEDLGASLGRREWKVPSRAFSSEEFRREFLKAVFDFSGLIRARKRKGRKERCLRLSSINKEGLMSLKVLLEMEGIKALCYKMGKGYVLEINGKHNLQIYAEKIGFENEKKRTLVKKILNPVEFERVNVS